MQQGHMMYGKQLFSLLSQHLPSIVILLAGISITVIASYQIRQQEISIANLEFSQRATETARQIHDLFTTSIDATTYLSAFLNTVDSITQKNFTAYAEKIIETNNTIQALEWIPLVNHLDADHFEQQNKASTPDFFIKERNTQGKLVPVAVRDSYYPVQFVVPLASNLPAVGYDIASDIERKKMLDLALQSKQLTASSRVRLVQEQGDSYGILVTRPVFYPTTDADIGKLRGYALGVYRIKSIIDNVLTRGGFRPSYFNLIDDSASAIDNQLYTSSTDTLPTDNWFTYTEAISIANRNYSIHISQDPQNFLPQYRFSTLILITGLLLTFITSIYLAILRNRHSALERSNNEMKNLMEEIKTLKGIIPICSYCHSIRDDEGAWEKLELYITKYSGASFSHGICPRCIDKVRSDESIPSAGE